MAISKVERLVNLVIALLSTRQFVTAEKIRASVAGYSECASDEAFSRMFERDKNELRDLGVPLETGRPSRSSTVEGYRINRDAYELPEIDLTREETAAVAVAAALWESPELTAAAQGAVLKLRAAGIRVDTDGGDVVAPLPPRARGSEPALTALLAAIDARRAVRFTHRSSPTEPWSTRTVEPWGVVTVHGRWYLVGHDRDRDAVRTFRLSRIGDEITAIGPEGAVQIPEGVDLRGRVLAATSPAEVSGSARLWVADGRAWELRRLGRSGAARRIGERDGVELEVPVRSWEWIARIVAGQGADALVLDPPELRAEVHRILEQAATDAGEEER
ncbi:proteasome accessory factor B [Rhodococcus rhodochrous J3]|uniref:Proteasome accessory factor B n=1 Tax=Rhodococcus rhodochrous J3 TaxID=903528 RepID=A0ABY1MI67_RHORH|nr:MULTISPECIES: YafY family protein [Rhodococcus]MBF4479504.1 YafY family transcriptional regulator [Rhodococcus rhodochrous]MCB8908594.1 YafY family transcriptional regulator [Rhodococcus rhodochrous]MDC3726725.1 YafY family transcriptional regulator [Rhodococcus sp. Rp3]MDO1486647.1 YafY family transcriptional regulator [Rhodococcus rhodochrous]TWH49665.1 proteasome accessory factor B [Rhodococcus rhodochrous J38]